MPTIHEDDPKVAAAAPSRPRSTASGSGPSQGTWDTRPYPQHPISQLPTANSAAAPRGRPACRHCGAPLLDAATQASGFCCAGCTYVYRLVHEHGLDGYYRIKDSITVPADPVVFHVRDYGWLETAQREAEQRAAAGAVPVLDLDVQGISCVGCVWLIERLFQQQPGARDIVVNAQLGTMRLRWIAGEWVATDFARKLQAFGYLVGPSAGGQASGGESRALVRRIGLCTAFAMNVMLFAFPVYFGMESSFAYAGLFGILSMTFGTLSLLVGGSYFLGRAVAALRAGTMHIDLPIAIGIVGAYAGSLYGWLAGEERFVYFDFVATFILLMLIGRWAQVAAVERNQRRLLRLQPKPPRLRAEDGTGITPDEITAGRRFFAAAGQAVPVAARLEGRAATFSLASINGEAAPRVFQTGQRIPAGAVFVGRDAVVLEAVEAWADSLLARLLQPSARPGWRQRLLERIVRGYLIGIIAVAVLSGLGWWFATGEALRTWSVVTAVLVVSCPCAIGLAFPLADEMATVALRRRGVFVREGDLWPKLAKIRRIVFDKTGTLTLETPVLRNPAALAALAPETRAALFELVADNPHPVSQCLLENLLAAGASPEFHPLDETLAEAGAPPTVKPAIIETVGYGVTFGPWSLGRPGWRGGVTGECQLSVDIPPPVEAVHDVELCRAGAVVARFAFTDAIRPNAQAEIAALQRDGFALGILSGDRQEKVSALAAELGLPAASALGDLSPQDKATCITAQDGGSTLMLGDGANDSLAFDRALCRGTPVIHRGVLEQKSDFYYLGRGIDGIRAMFAINAVRARTQRRILVFSVLYNLLAVGLAVAGHMNPLVAAIMMPINSMLTLLIVTGGMRSVFGNTH
jgi:Cu2+-exporting ATPase